MFTKWLRPTHAGNKYAIFAVNSLNLHRAPVSLVRTVLFDMIHSFSFYYDLTISATNTESLYDEWWFRGRKKVSRRKTDLFGRGCHGNGDAGNSASTELRGYFDVGAVGLVNSIITTMLTKLMKAYLKH